MTLAVVQQASLNEWVELLRTRFRIEVSEDRQPAFLNSLSTYAETLGQTPEGLYGLAVRRHLTEGVWQQIVHLATNHETRFFRNPAVISLVATLAGEFTRPRVLSVGCSTGEEVYTLAVEFSRRELPNYTIHGTDISKPCIETAVSGRYRYDPSIEDRFATQVKPSSMEFKSWIKDFVSFEVHNVLSSRPHNFASPNIILTQHMLIYYRVSTRIKILESLACQLPRGGYLVIAASEEANWKPEGFERLNNLPATVFRKSK